MNPNAIGNQRDQQIAQLKALRTASAKKLDTTLKAQNYLQKATTEIESIGKVPGLTDVHKIGAAIKYLALAQLVNADINVDIFKAEIETIDAALKQATSPIIGVSIGGSQ